MLGIDSSAAQAILKLRDSLTNQFGIKLSIFVPGSTDGFPCEVNIYDDLNSQATVSGVKDLASSGSNINDQTLLARLSGSQVCDDLDAALVYAEVSVL